MGIALQKTTSTRVFETAVVLIQSNTSTQNPDGCKFLRLISENDGRIVTIHRRHNISDYGIHLLKKIPVEATFRGRLGLM